MVRYASKTPEERAAMRARAAEILASGGTYYTCMNELGVDHRSVREWFDDDYRRHRREKEKKNRQSRAGQTKAPKAISYPITRTARGQPNIVLPPLRYLPDTRDHTGKLLGDPLPERSALAQKRSHETVHHLRSQPARAD